MPLRPLVLVVALVACLVTGIALVAAQPAAPAAPHEPRALLADLTLWQPLASDGVEVHIAPDAPGPSGLRSLRIDFNFTRGAGYCGAVLPVAIDLPDNFTVDLSIRGTGPANNLEIKLADAPNLNVWWVNRRAFEWPADWAPLQNQRRHFQFAWGPDQAAGLRRVGRAEIMIASARGGKGSVWLDGLTLRELPPAAPSTGRASARTSSVLDADHTSYGIVARDGAAAAANGAPGWLASPTDRAPALTLDMGVPTEVGGLAIQWPSARPAAFSIEASLDGAAWSPVMRVRQPLSDSTWIALPGVQARALRLTLARSAPDVPAAPAQPEAPVAPSATAAASSLGVSRVRILPPALGDSPNAFFAERALSSPRGTFPREFLAEQSYWTVVGVPDDDREALINEEGQIELDKHGFSLEPFLVVDGRLLSWADGKHTQSLRDGWVPIPTVTRTHENGLTLRATALAAGPGGSSCLYPSYTLTNTADRPLRGRLAIAIRPFQVLPPWQDLNITGGFTPLRSIVADQRGIVVNQSTAILPGQLHEVSAVTADQGDAVELLAKGTLPTESSATCPRGAASGIISFDWELKPGERAVYFLCIPLHGLAPPTAHELRPTTTEHLDRLAAATAVAWRTAVNRVTFDLPPSASAFVDTLRAQQAYVLINRDGKGFQPGSRTYERSWIRDGALTSAAMLSLGHTGLVKDFIDWYAPFQFESGKVPCVVDTRGPDPVPENDSHGQLIYTIATYHRFTGDTETVRRHFGSVRRAVAYMQTLRATRLTPEFSEGGPPRQEPGKPAVPAVAFRGLLPESISHEGYSAKPMHSYWDDLFALRGITDAAYLAGVVGEADMAASWAALAQEFRAGLVASIGAAQAAHGINYIPGCVEYGDFDSTSTTVALWPLGDAGGPGSGGGGSVGLPRKWLDATFDRAWSEFVKRRDDPSPTWEAFTPYELRHVGAYLRLAHADRAWQSLKWYMGFQRPAGWHHWAEVAWRDPLAPKMIGDMPHTWCGSDFLSAARALFVYEREGPAQLVVCSGLPEEWTADPSGVAARNLPTHFGTLSLRISRRPAAVGGVPGRTIELSGSATPRGGIIVQLPSSHPLRSATLNDRPATFTPTSEVRVDTLPATLVLEYEP